MLLRVGLYDTVYVSSDVAAAWQLQCHACGRCPDAEYTWQTKALDPGMVSYFLRYDENGDVRLYLLDRPTDRRLWHPWTEEEIAESEREASERGGLFQCFVKKRGEGHFLPEAFLPAHRRQRFMGELPHQWVDIYGNCACGKWQEHWIKFCDGVAAEIRAQPPKHNPGFFDEACDLGDGGHPC